MKTKTSRRAVLLRSILLLPLFSLLLIGFSETKVVHEQIKSDTNNLIQINDIPPPIKIHINEKQEITIEEEVIAVEDISQTLSQLIKSDSSKPNSVREVYIEANGNLNLKLLTSIKEQITKEGYILKTVTADIVQVMNKTLENYRGIEFIARDTFHLKQDDGTFVLGFTTKENPVISQTNSSTITVQDSATTKELAEYTKLAKHYNSMSGNKMKIYKKDVERLEYLFSKMSKKQKATAEPFPDFPVPPPAPRAPRAVNEREEALHTIETIIENQDPYDNVHANIMSEENVRVYQYTSKREPTEKINLELYAEKLGLTDAQFYFEGEKISTNKGLKIIKNGNIKVETFPYKNKQPEVRIYKSDSKGTIPPPPHSPEAPKVLKGSVSTIAPPPSTVVIKGTASSIPTPPEPMTPLDHVIAMAKKDATFLYEGKEISSDKAINLMKTNKDLNIDSRTAKGKKPVVKISTEPISH
jgi:biopolymer transport protein ExbD